MLVRTPILKIYLFAILAFNVHTAAIADNLTEAEQSYQLFRSSYSEANTVQKVRATIPLGEAAHKLAPSVFKYPYALGIAYKSLAQLTGLKTDYERCSYWTSIALQIPANEKDKETASTLRNLCVFGVAQINVRATQEPGYIEINFATKTAALANELDIKSDLESPLLKISDARMSPKKVAERLEEQLPDYEVAYNNKLVVATEKYSGRSAQKHLLEVAYFVQLMQSDLQRQLPEKPLVIFLGDNAHSMSSKLDLLYPGQTMPSLPFFGLYQSNDHLILAAVEGGYGTLLHEIAHALLEPESNVPNWLEEGIATLYERTSLNQNSIKPLPNWRLNSVQQDNIQGFNVFESISEPNSLSPKELSWVRQMLLYLHHNAQLIDFINEVAKTGPHTLPLDAIQKFNVDKSKWESFAELKKREYLAELSLHQGIGLSNPAEIRYLQQALNQIMQTDLVVDGLSGPSTKTQVKAFQQKYDLAVDGIVGPKTLQMIDKKMLTTSLDSEIGNGGPD